MLFFFLLEAQADGAESVKSRANIILKMECSKRRIKSRQDSHYTLLSSPAQEHIYKVTESHYTD